MGRKVLECADLAYEYDHHREDFGLQDVTLKLKAGKALGVIGLNGAGKSTLCKVLAKPNLPGAAACDWRPTKGRVRFWPAAVAGERAPTRVDPHEGVRAAAGLMGFLVAATAAVALGPAEVAEDVVIDRGTIIFVAALVLATWATATYLRRDADARYRRRVVYCSTEHDLARHETNDAAPLADAICGPLRGALDKAEREALAERLLAWSDFAVTDADGATKGDAPAHARDASLTCGALSGGQRHLVYFLRCVAPCFCPADRARRWPLFGKRSPPPVDVLVLDEAFNCLDADVRPRCLRLALEVKAAGTALLVVAQDMHELAVLCDDAICVAGGRVAQGPEPFAKLVSPSPKHRAATRAYVDAYWELERDMKAAAGHPALTPAAYAAAAGAELRRVIASLPPLRRWGPPWDGSRLARGDVVEIDGLGAQRRFNGKRARVAGLAGEGASARIKVKLADGQVLAVQRCHLKRAAATTGA